MPHPESQPTFATDPSVEGARPTLRELWANRDERGGAKAIAAALALSLVASAGVAGALFYRGTKEAYEAAQRQAIEEVRAGVVHGEITDEFADIKMQLGGYTVRVGTRASLTLEGKHILSKATKQVIGTHYEDTLKVEIKADRDKTTTELFPSIPLRRDLPDDYEAKPDDPTRVRVTFESDAFSTTVSPANIVNTSRFTPENNLTGTLRDFLSHIGPSITVSRGGLPEGPTKTDQLLNLVESGAMGKGADFAAKECGGVAMGEVGDVSPEGKGLWAKMVKEIKKDAVREYNATHPNPKEQITVDDVSVVVKGGIIVLSSPYTQELEDVKRTNNTTQNGVTMTIDFSADNGQVTCQPLSEFATQPPGQSEGPR